MTSARGALVAVLLGTFLGGLDLYIVNLALPVIAGDFGADVAAAGWVTLAYALAVASLLVAAGRAADVWGSRRVYVLGLLGLAGASVLASLAISFPLLVAARALQGVSAALVTAAGQAAVATAVPEGERGRALGWTHAAGAAGFATGPTLGGLLVEAFGWRSAFWVTATIALIAAGVAVRSLPQGLRVLHRHFDIGGAASLSAAVLLLLLAGFVGQRGTSVDASMGLALGGLLAIVAFVQLERRAAEPTLDLALLRRSPVAAGLLAAFLTFVAMASNMYLVPFLLQGPLGLPTARAGLIMVAVPVVILIVAPRAGRWADVAGPRVPATVGLGFVILAIAGLAAMGAGAPSWVAILLLAIYGLGAGLFQAPNNAGVLGAVPPERIGAASGTLATTRNLGQVVGVGLASWAWTLFGGEAAGLSAFRGAFLLLAVVAMLAMAASWARGPRESPREERQIAKETAA